MKKCIFSLILQFGLGVFWGFAQDTPKSTYLMPHAGYSLEVIVIETTTFPSSGGEPYIYYGVHGGIYYAFLHRNDAFSLGIDPSLHFGLSVPEITSSNQEFTVDYNVHMPIMLLSRFLRGSTPYSRKPVGFGVGLGVIANHYKRTTSSVLNQKATFLHPAAMLEGNFSTGRGHISVKFRIPIGMVTSKLEYSNAQLNRDFNFSTWGLVVAYGFEKRRR